MLRRLATALFLRRLVRALDQIAEVQRAQTQLLGRLVDHLAPADPRTTRADVSADTGVSHLDEAEAAQAIAYITRIAQQTGHIPDDEEVLIHLADEKTQDLHQRLTTRDDELTRLREAREW